jgi:hypothetical protein
MTGRQGIKEPIPKKGAKTKSTIGISGMVQDVCPLDSGEDEFSLRTMHKESKKGIK